MHNNLKLKNLSFGLIFSFIGLLAYFVLSHGESLTAMIPTFFGIPLLILGVSLSSSSRVHLFLSLILVVILLAGTVPGLIKFFPLVFSDAVYARPMAIKVQAITGLLSIIYLVLSIFSFTNKKR